MKESHRTHACTMWTGAVSDKHPLRQCRIEPVTVRLLQSCRRRRLTTECSLTIQGFVGKTSKTQSWGNVFNYTHSHQVGVVDNEAVRTVVCFPMCLLTKKSSPGVGRLLVGSVRADLTFSTPESVTSFLLARVHHKPSLIPSSACGSGLVKLFCTQGPSTTLLKAI